jgi:virulence factor Mce-like protein
LPGTVWDLLRRPVVVLVAGVVVIELLVWGAVAVVSGPATYVVTAMFPSAPGLYDGNSVDVLGYRIGSVQGVKPAPGGVTVTMRIDDGITLPASVKAFLMAPNVVNDRYVQLDPAYTAGPTLARGGVIPRTRTFDPVSIDQIIDSLNQLSSALGPQGANANGSLSSLLHAAAVAFGGDGPSLNTTLDNVGTVLGAVSSNTDDVTTLLDSLGGLTKAAAGTSSAYEHFASDLAQVSSALSGDDQEVGTALRTLQQVLTSLNGFVQTNHVAIGSAVSNLSDVAAAVGSEQQAVGQALGATPTALAHLGDAVNAAAPGGPAVATRYDPVGAPVVQTLCGDSVLRMLLLAVDQAQDRDKPLDLACAASQLIQSLPPVPGAPSASGFTEQALTAASSNG